MFVRKKRGRNGDYYQLVESRRVDGKPRQRVLLHLGRHPTIEAALKAWPREIKRLRRDADGKRELVPVGSEIVPMYRDLLKTADSLDGHAVSLGQKFERLQELRASSVVPTQSAVL